MKNLIKKFLKPSSHGNTPKNNNWFDRDSIHFRGYFTTTPPNNEFDLAKAFNHLNSIQQRKSILN